MDWVGQDPRNMDDLMDGRINGKMTGWVRQKIWRERKVIDDVAGSEVGNSLDI